MSDWEKELEAMQNEYSKKFGWVSVGYDWSHNSWTLRKFQGERLKTFRLPNTLNINDVYSLIRSSLELGRDVLFENSKLQGGKFIKKRRECPPGVVY